MRSLPLFRFNSRARSTSWGIALCTMFIVASFSVVSGLRTSMDKLANNFESDLFLVTDGDMFSPDDLSSIIDQSALGAYTLAVAQPPGMSVTVFAVSDPNHVLPEVLAMDGNDVRVGSSLSLAGNITLHSIADVDSVVVGKYSSSIFPSNWILGSQSLLNSLANRSGDAYNFAVAKNLTKEELRTLEGKGFVVQPFVGIIQFLDSGVNEIQADATWVLVPSSVFVALLAYSYIGSEISDRRHEIGILKTIGAGRKKVLSYVLSGAALICGWGAALGLALGIVLSYGLATAASSLFTSVFVIHLQESLLGMSYLVTLAAGVVGALVPALRMAMTRPVDDLKEAS
jgi:ABC-type antimicrobial peptide transport system permease subunit